MDRAVLARLEGAWHSATETLHRSLKKMGEKSPAFPRGFPMSSTARPEVMRYIPPLAARGRGTSWLP
jgi:hypothetical protein